MIKWVRVWLVQRRQLAQLTSYVNGWNWAAGELLRGTPVEEVDAQIARGADFDRTAFDDGACAASAAWERSKRREDWQFGMSMENVFPEIRH